YDQLNGALVAAEVRFKATADELQLKQNSIVNCLSHKQQVDATLSGLASATVRTHVGGPSHSGVYLGGPTDGINGSLSLSGLPSTPRVSLPAGVSELPI